MPTQDTLTSSVSFGSDIVKDRFSTTTATCHQDPSFLYSVNSVQKSQGNWKSSIDFGNKKTEFKSSSLASLPFQPPTKDEQVKVGSQDFSKSTIQGVIYPSKLSKANYKTSNLMAREYGPPPDLKVKSRRTLYEEYKKNLKENPTNEKAKAPKFQSHSVVLGSETCEWKSTTKSSFVEQSYSKRESASQANYTSNWELGSYGSEYSTTAESGSSYIKTCRPTEKAKSSKVDFSSSLSLATENVTEFATSNLASKQYKALDCGSTYKKKHCK